MALKGHVFKEIQRKMRTCIIEDGLSPDQCVSKMEEDYVLDESDKKEIKELAKEMGK